MELPGQAAEGTKIPHERTRADVVRFTLSGRSARRSVFSGLFHGFAPLAGAFYRAYCHPMVDRMDEMKLCCDDSIAMLSWSLEYCSM